jgi:hypothetical protein
MAMGKLLSPFVTESRKLAAETLPWVTYLLYMVTISGFIRVLN